MTFKSVNYISNTIKDTHNLTYFIQPPKYSRYIQINDWQVEFCQSNHCAAFILSYLLTTYDLKKSKEAKPDVGNYFDFKDLIDGCMGLYDEDVITEGVELLVSLGVILVHEYPRLSRNQENFRYLLFCPHVCKKWLEENHLNTRCNVADVLDALVDKGFPTDRLKFPEDLNKISKLIFKGATSEHFITAIETAMDSASICLEDVGIDYVSKIVENSI